MSQVINSTYSLPRIYLFLSCFLFFRLMFVLSQVFELLMFSTNGVEKGFEDGIVLIYQGLSQLKWKRLEKMSILQEEPTLVNE